MIYFETFLTNVTSHYQFSTSHCP